MSDQLATMLRSMEPVQSAPMMRTINGFGFRLAGRLLIPGANDAYVSAHCFVVLFIPLVPLGFYVMSGANPYRFFGKVKWSTLHGAFGSRAWLLALSGVGEGLLMLTALFAMVGMAAWLAGRHRY